MDSWLVATVAGCCLGAAFFLCVRLRMRLAPLARERFGNWARGAVWLLTILLMIALANGMLLGLRGYWAGSAPANPALLEIWSGLLALGIGLSLVFRRIHRRRMNGSNGS